VLVEAVVLANPRLVVWSAAPPGQAWEGHVHLQPPEYWLGQFGRLLYAPDSAGTALLRARMLETDAQHVHCRDNFYLLDRGLRYVGGADKVHHCYCGRRW
jgi:hypothetical protein